MLCPSPRKHHARLSFPRVIEDKILCLMKDRSILENKAESARTNCPSCSNPTQYSCSELSSHFLSPPLAFWVSGRQFELLLSSPHSSSNLQHQTCLGRAFSSRNQLSRGILASRRRTLEAIHSATAPVGDQTTSDTVVLHLCGFLNDLLEVYTRESLLKEV